MTKCRYCQDEVIWRTSAKGNKYLAVQAEIRGDDGRVIKVIYPAHECRATPEERAAIDAARPAAPFKRGDEVVLIDHPHIYGQVFFVKLHEEDEYRIGFGRKQYKAASKGDWTVGVDWITVAEPADSKLKIKQYVKSDALRILTEADKDEIVQIVLKQRQGETQ
jgi:hypothetical protein